MISYNTRRRRSQELSKDASFSPQNSSMPQPAISLHATGKARIIFRFDPTTFEGVLISDDKEDTFSVTAKPSSRILSENNQNRVVDVSVSDGETGQLYVIRRVDLLPPQFSLEEETEREGGVFQADVDFDNTRFCTLSKPVASNSANENVEIPHYELRSDSLQFSTDEILVGNRADKEIRMFLNPALVGRKLNVHIGRMTVKIDAPITPPPTPVFERHLRRKLSLGLINGTRSTDSADGNEVQATRSDADINFLM